MYVIPDFSGLIISPGRFFAANELKAMLAFVVMNFDVRLADGSKEVPPNHYIGTNISPNTSAKVMFRRRDTSALSY